MTKLIKISELSKILDLTTSSKKKTSNHIIRYWEKEFKQIRPKVINNHRYYPKDQVEIIKLIKFLLKDKGLTISGVKKILNSNVNKLDDYNSSSLKADYYKKKIKQKSENILKKLERLKKYGKKNTH
tara:strand:- start:181 stop:561 length:381 start_codon:yes stop_codon:yes gene_type:complete